MRAATVVQVLQDLFYVLLQLHVTAIVLSFKFHCMFYFMFYFTCDHAFTVRLFDLFTLLDFSVYICETKTV